MCLYYDKKKSRQWAFWKRIFGPKTVTCYKALDVTHRFVNGKQSDELIVITPFRSMEVEGGWIQSGRELGPQLSDREKKTNKIHYGIHVILNEKRAEEYTGTYTFIVKCTARVRDFVARDGIYDEAVFSKIHIPQSEIDRILAYYEENKDRDKRYDW